MPSSFTGSHLLLFIYIRTMAPCLCWIHVMYLVLGNKDQSFTNALMSQLYYTIFCVHHNSIHFFHQMLILKYAKYSSLYYTHLALAFQCSGKEIQSILCAYSYTMKKLVQFAQVLSKHRSEFQCFNSPVLSVKHSSLQDLSL